MIDALCARRAGAPLIVLAAMLVAFDARPDDSAAPDPAEEIFDQSVLAYQAGRFADAIALLRRAYALRAEPVLLYNMGRAYEGLGDQPNALQAYRQYLELDPAVVDRPSIERRIATLDAQIRERDRLEEARRRAASGPGAWPWVTAGVGGAVLVAGTAFGLVARARASDARDEVTQTIAVAKQDDAERFATFANVGFVTGSIVTATGLLWGVLTLPARANATPANGPGASMRIGPSHIELSGSF